MNIEIMKKRLARKQILLAFIGLPLAFGSINNCPNGTANSSVSNGAGTSTQTIPGVPGTPANDFVSLGSVGCTAVDLTFSNFTGTFSGAGDNGIESLAGTYMAETPAGIASPDTLLFATVRGAATGPDGDPNDGNNNWVTTHGTGTITDDLSYSVSDSAAAVSSIVLTAFGASIDSSASGSITVDVCKGITSSATITTSGACTTAGGTAFVTMQLPLATLASQNLTVSLGTPSNAFDITTEIALVTNGGNGKFGSLDTFTESFDEGVPEPSTFVLLGTALAGIGVLRARRKKA